MNAQTPKKNPDCKGASIKRHERALKALQMHEAGASTLDIAEYFNLSRRMVQADIKLAKDLLKEEIAKFDGMAFLAKEIVFWEQMVTQAMQEYQVARTDNAKVGFMRVASEARAKLVKILQDSGLLTTVPERVVLEENIPFDDPEVRKLYLEFLKAARKKGEKELGL